jgi:hypothetical protein
MRHSTKRIGILTIKNVNFELWSTSSMREYPKPCIETVWHLEALHPLTKKPWPEFHLNKFNARSKGEILEYIRALRGVNLDLKIA